MKQKHEPGRDCHSLPGQDQKNFFNDTLAYRSFLLQEIAQKRFTNSENDTSERQYCRVCEVLNPKDPGYHEEDNDGKCWDCGRLFDPSFDPCDTWSEEDWDAEERRRGLAA